MRISARQLEAFIYVAECNSFTDAAERLQLSTSAVSNLVSELESSIGTRLFERSTRRVVLNDVGRLLLPTVLSFVRSWRDVERLAETLSDPSFNLVRVAAPMVIACSILPPIIAEYQKSCPETEILIVDTGVEWLADRVAAGEVDLAIGPDRPTDNRVTAEVLMPSPWVVWISSKNPLSDRPVLRWSDLKNVKFHAGGHDHERIMSQVMAGLRAEDQIIPGQVFDNISTALGLAAANLGVTFCPAYVAPLACTFDLKMKRLVDPEFTRYVTLYSSASHPPSAAVSSFGEFLRMQYRDRCEAITGPMDEIKAP